MLWVAFTTAFFGFLRVSEFVAPAASSIDPSRTLLLGDIIIQNDCAYIHIKRSKAAPLPGVPPWFCQLQVARFVQSEHYKYTRYQSRAKALNHYSGGTMAGT